MNENPKSKYTAVYQLSPPGMFGLPEEGVVVSPAGRQIYSGAIDLVTGELVSQGTLSLYRDQAFVWAGEAGGGSINFNDNYLSISVEGTGADEALEKTSLIASDVCNLLALDTGCYVSYRFVSASRETPTQSKVELPRAIELFRLRTYNNEKLAQTIGELPPKLENNTDRLRRSFAYLQYSLFLVDNLAKIPIATHRDGIVWGQVLLHSYKSISAIIGDPSKDKDYQSRYKTLGITKEEWDEIELVRQARNKLDVAHYSLDNIDSASLESIARKGMRLATNVLRSAVNTMPKADPVRV